MVSGRISAKRKRVASGMERAGHFLAVAGAAGLHHQEHPGLVHVQPRAQQLVAYLEHVGAEIGQVAKQLGQGSRTIRQPAAERSDFGIGKRLPNLPALREAGISATRRMLAVEKISHDPADGQATIRQITSPLITATGTRIAGLRLGDPRVHALLAVHCAYSGSSPAASPTATCVPSSRRSSACPPSPSPRRR